MRKEEEELHACRAPSENFFFVNKSVKEEEKKVRRAESGVVVVRGRCLNAGNLVREPKLPMRASEPLFADLEANVRSLSAAEEGRKCTGLR